MTRKRLAFVLLVAWALGISACGAKPTTQPLAITTSVLPTPVLGQAYSVQLQAIGGKAPYTWSLGSGQMPPDLTLSPRGVLSGTITSADTGQWTFVIWVTDSSKVTVAARIQLGGRV